MGVEPTRRLAAALFFGALLSGDARGAIDVERLSRHVARLAADAQGGRDTTEPGIRRAERYLAREFRRIGLQPLPGRGSHLIPFPIFIREDDPRATQLTIRGVRGLGSARLGRDFRPLDASGEGEVEGEIVFAGYGITAPEFGHDDYAGLDVHGRVVLVFSSEPRANDPESPFDGTTSTRHSGVRAKLELARARGARAVLLVTDPARHDGSLDLRPRRTYALDPSVADGSGAAEGFVAVEISRSWAESIAATSAYSLLGLQREVDLGTSPAELPLVGPRASVTVRRSIRPRRATARNVAAWLPGADPLLRDEWIVIGAHHDHLGRFEGSGDTIFNGADDNASGAAAVLALARSWAERPVPPARSLVFVTFSGEERGLLGSRAAVERGQLPVERLRLMINLDMVGRNPERPLQVWGDGHARALSPIVEAAAEASGVEVLLHGDGHVANSDHEPFFNAGVPFLFFFTGTHADYHRTSDSFDRIDIERLFGATRLADETLKRLVDAPALPSFVHVVSWLGIRVEGTVGASAPRVTHVLADALGATVGLREGDEILAIDGERVVDSSGAGSRFRTIAPGRDTLLSILREGEMLNFTVERPRPGYLGISFDEPNEDQRRLSGLGSREGLIVTDLNPEGPARFGGMRSGDILLSLGGQPIEAFGLPRRLEQLGAGTAIEAVVLRGGERLTLQIELGEQPPASR